MATYKTPGVFVKEVSLATRSVKEVATAVPAFIGHTQTAKDAADDDLCMKPFRIRSLAEYEIHFGSTDPLLFTVNLVQNSTSGIVTIPPIDEPSPSYLPYACMKMFFANGGGPCYIVSVGDLVGAVTVGDDHSGLQGSLQRLEKEDEPTLIVIPEAVRLGAPAQFFSIMNAALAQCEKMTNRFAIMDIYGENVARFRSSIASDLD